MCLGNISKGFRSINMKITGLNRYTCESSVDYNIIDTNNIINIHKYLMKKQNIQNNVWNYQQQKKCLLHY